MTRKDFSNLPVRKTVHGKFKATSAMLEENMIDVLECLVKEFNENKELQKRVTERIKTGK